MIILKVSQQKNRVLTLRTKLCPEVDNFIQ